MILEPDIEVSLKDRINGLEYERYKWLKNDYHKNIMERIRRKLK